MRWHKLNMRRLLTTGMEVLWESQYENVICEIIYMKMNCVMEDYQRWKCKMLIIINKCVRTQCIFPVQLVHEHRQCQSDFDRTYELLFIKDCLQHNIKANFSIQYIFYFYPAAILACYMLLLHRGASKGEAQATFNIIGKCSIYETGKRFLELISPSRSVGMHLTSF